MTALAGFTALLLTWTLCGSDVRAQSVSPQLRIAIPENNREVYIYHTASPSIGHGFNIYRKDEGREEFVQLNKDPIRAVASGAELRAFLGTLYDDVAAATQQENANGTLAKLRSDIRTANLLTFSYPQMAQALGRLYIDKTATLETPVTYRVEFVDAGNEATDLLLERTTLLLTHRPAAPTGLRAQNAGRKVSLYWRYMTPTELDDDKVIRFEAFRIDPATNQPRRLHENIILRNNALYEYALTFEVPTVGQTEQLYLTAIDITGQSSEPSELLRFEVIDSHAPGFIQNVQARAIAEGRVRISWPAGESPDVVGYNLYRSTVIANEESYVRLNTRTLASNRTTYEDTFFTAAGSRAYFYCVTALDEQGNESAFSNAAMALVEDLEAPAAPFALTAEYLGDGSVRLQWQMPPIPGDFKTFVVLRRRLGPGAPSTDSRSNLEDITDTTYVDHGEARRGFLEGATYRFTVMGTDRNRNMSKGAFVDLRIPNTTPPTPPNGVRARIDDASSAVIAWNPSPSLDVMSYIVYRNQEGTSRLLATPLSAHERMFVDEYVVTGQRYLYWVTAADSAGNESARSRVDTLFMRDFVPPRYVRNVRAKPHDDGGIAVQWEPVVASDLVGYRVYRALAAAGLYEHVHTLPVADTRWVDERGMPGQWYKVQAIDTSGNESKSSRPACAIASGEQ